MIHTQSHVNVMYVCVCVCNVILCWTKNIYWEGWNYSFSMFSYTPISPVNTVDYHVLRIISSSSYED